jgi:hypothetical protein
MFVPGKKFHDHTGTKGGIKVLAVLLLVACAASLLFRLRAAKNSGELKGNWAGLLPNPEFGSLRFVMHARVSTANRLEISIDSFDQGELRIACDIISTGNNLVFNVPSLHSTYRGKLSADGRTIVGKLNLWPLDFEREPNIPDGPPKLSAMPPMSLNDLGPVLDREFEPMTRTGLLNRSIGGEW